MAEKEFLGLAALLLMLASRGVYLKSIFAGMTRPHIFSWVIWATISGIGFSAQVAEHAGPGAWARGFGAATCLLIVALAWKRGETDITRGDWITFVTALAAIPLWMITKTPVWSVILVCIIDTIGYFPTLRKSWEKPHEELPTGYLTSSVGALCSALAIENYTLSTWLYPAVLTLSNGMMGGFLLLRRRNHRQTASAGL